MKIISNRAVSFLIILLAFAAHAKIITVNTGDNTDFSAGKTNLVTAINSLADGDTIQFNIPGAGAHRLITPPIVYAGGGGYPIITNNNVTIDGFSQPGSSPNSNTILATNNAVYNVVLDSTAGGANMWVTNGYGNYDPIAGTGANSEAGVLLVAASGFHLQGVCIVGLFGNGDDSQLGPPAVPSYYGIALGGGATNIWISGCWIGMDVNGATTNVLNKCVTAYGASTARNQGITIGVKPGSLNPRAEQNVLLAGSIVLAIEGSETRISGNRLGVLPDGKTCLDFDFYSGMSGGFCSQIEIGRRPANTLVGTDGDGVNDAEERNIFAAVDQSGDDSGVIDFYGSGGDSGLGLGTNIVFAGNYVGVGIDGQPLTLTSGGIATNVNSVVAGLGGTPSRSIRIGSDFDGVSDDIEGNVILMNYPFDLVYGPTFSSPPPGFIYTGATGSSPLGLRCSVRGNVTINCSLSPFAYADGAGGKLDSFTNYESLYMDTNSPIIPTLDPTSVFPHVKGTFAPGIAPYTTVMVDIYQLDPEGWTNGQKFALMELTGPTYTNGFPQGKKFLAQFAIPNTGSFDVSLPANTDLGSSGMITATANYSADPAGTHNGRVHSSNFANPIQLSGGSAIVNQSGTGDFTTIQAAIDSGATLITITDSGHYIEDLQIGDPSTGGAAVTLTSTQCGANRPVISPSAGKSYVNSRRSSQNAGFGLFAPNSTVANLIIEANPDLNVGAMNVMATNVLIKNCLFRIASGTTATLGATSTPLLFFGQQGDGAGNVTGPQNPDGCVVKDCEFIGVAPDASPLEPVPGNLGYLGQKSDSSGTGQGSGYLRSDIYTSTGYNIVLTLDGCYFHHDRDYGVFPSDYGANGGTYTVVINKCRFDANGKFFIRGRGANIDVRSSVFTRSGQHLSSDTQNSAVALGYQDGHIPTGSVTNCVFVNCGSARYQQAYFGGINNDSGDLITVDHCTFVDCVSGVTAGTQTSGGTGGAGNLSITNCIFHQIGDSIPPAVDYTEVTLTNGSPGLVGGLYPAWAYGLTNYVNKWAAVFNRYNWNNTDLMILDKCLVGSIDSEDSRTWDAALAANTQTGARLYAGYPTNFVIGTVTRATPVFVTTDTFAPNAYQLTSGSPGQGLGANLAPVLSPQLAYSRSGNQLTISWDQPVWLDGVLMSTPSLTNPVWTPVAGVCNNSVTVTIGAGDQYFAIRKL